MLPWKQAYERWRSDLTLNIQLYVRFNWGAAFAKFSRSYFTLRVWASLPVVARIPRIWRRKLWRGSVWELLILPQRFSLTIIQTFVLKHLNSSVMVDASSCLQDDLWFLSPSLRTLTSRISLILEPPLPMREPHWLAGMTNLKVTGGLLVTVPLATNAARSWERDGERHRVVTLTTPLQSDWNHSDNRVKW